MADPSKTIALDVEGRAAPPRKNGELVFDTPWESRLFGITMALHQAGLFDWEEFRRLLIAEVETWERRAAGGSEAGWSYYACWQAALERLLAGKGLCGAGELARRAAELATRPVGHDH